MSLPNDPYILLSVINTRLRDFYPNLEEYCKAEGNNPDVVKKALKGVGYVYSPERNQFIKE